VTSALWVSQLIVSKVTKTKLAAKHGLDWRDIKEAIVGVAGLRYLWDDDPERGRRALVEVGIGATLCIVVLYPVDDPLGDVYALGSAYRR
jgi:hypothetical protein